MSSTDREHQLAARLGATPVFAALTWSDRLALAREGVRRSLTRGTALYRHGDESTSIALVLRGRLAIRRHASSGKTVTLRHLESGALLGLSTAAGAAHSADVIAAAETDVLLLPAAALRRLFAENPDLAMRAVVQLASWISSLSDELEALRSADIYERTRTKILELAAGRREITLTHQELADQINASRPNVSRALKRLEKSGEIRLGRGRIAFP